LGAASLAAAQPPVTVSVVAATQAVDIGAAVEVEVRLNTAGNDVGGGGVFLDYDETRLRFESGSLATEVWTAAFLNSAPREVQGGVVSFSVGANPAAFGGDLPVATLAFTAIGTGSAVLDFLFNPGAEDTMFTAVDLSTEFATRSASGTVTINGPVPTATQIPAPTPTAAPTAIVPACSGDCSSDGSVTVDEILALVGIGLGSVDLSACLQGDVNEDGEITVDEILTAVRHALNGCPPG